MTKKKVITPKTYTQIVSEMIKKLEEERKREKEILEDDLKEATKGKKIKIEGNLVGSSYLFN